jgi:hypothetical protein
MTTTNRIESSVEDAGSTLPADTPPRLEDRRSTETKPLGMRATSTGDIDHGARIEFHPAKARRKSRGGLNSEDVDRALAILDDIENDNEEEVTLKLHALRGVIARLWEKTESGVQYYGLVLSLIETAILSLTALTLEQAAAVRGAVRALTLPSIGEEHYEIIQSHFIDAGISPTTMGEFDVSEEG